MGQVGGSQHCPVPGSSLEVRLLAQRQQSRPLSVRFFHTQPDSMDTHVQQKFILNSKTARHISRRVGSAPVCQGLEGWEPLAWAFLWTQPTAPAHWWGPCVHLSLREPYQPPRPLHPFAQGQILHPGHFTITRPRPDQHTHYFLRVGNMVSDTNAITALYIKMLINCKFHFLLPFTIPLFHVNSLLFVSAATTLGQVFWIAQFNNLLTN